jgi:hypothetical protein
MYVTEGIDNLILKIDSTIISIPKEIYHSYGTDTGSGRTREGLTIKLNKCQRSCSLDRYLSSTYTMYGMNLQIQSLYKKFFSDKVILN